MAIASDIAHFVSSELAKRANPEKAAAMQRYMKTEMPFYGVQGDGRKEILRRLWSELPIATRADYYGAIEALWALPHREEKYFALAVANRYHAYKTVGSLPLYKRLIVEGAWWDFVDDVASHDVGPVVRADPQRGWATVDRWIDDDDMWLRRTAIICQLGAKDQTDTDRLFGFCRRRMHESEFFIRKGIGWALRQYSYTDPDAVIAFLQEHEHGLSHLSYREGAKGLRRLGLME